MDPREALVRAATYLKWFRDRAITVDTRPPDDIGELIVVLEQLADQVDNARPRER
jgi:hypothetical protein